MKKQLAGGLLAAGILSLAGGTSPAMAAHCVAPDGSSPGFSYFGTVHVQNADHPEGGNPGPHAGTSGASNCRETTGSPSGRAPGQR